MAKYRVVQKGSLVTIKSRLSRKDTVNEREAAYLMQNHIQGLFRISYDGKKTIEYTAVTAIPLKKYLKGKLLTEQIFWKIIVQILDAVQKVETSGLHIGNLWLDMDTIFINETTAELYFLYQPLMNAAASASAFALINDITYLERKKNIGVQSGYLEEFQEFLCSKDSYRLENLEAYISRICPEFFRTTASPNRGKSGNLEREKKYTTQLSKQREGTICLLEDDDEDEGTVSLKDEGDTVCLMEEDDEPPTTRLAVEEDEYGETTMLSQQKQPQLILIQIRTGTRKKITSSPFFIGKSKVSDYCVSGNSNVSRKHAVILRKDAEFYLKDENSTNGTFLNDVRVREDEEALLENGDKVMLADEEFEIEIR